MPRRLLAAMAAILLVAGQAGSALAAATAAKGAAGPAASAPIQKGLLGDLASGKADQLRRRVLGEGRPARRREGQGPHRPRQVRPRHADRERPEVAGRRPGAREQVGHQGEELLALQRDDRPGHREAGPGVRESEGRHRGARREDLPARQAGPVQGRHPGRRRRSRVGRREDRRTRGLGRGHPRPGRRRRQRRHRRRFHPPRARQPVPRQQRRRHVHPRLQLVGPQQRLRRRAVRQRRPRDPHDGHDGRRRRTRPVHARRRRRARRPLDRGQGLRARGLPGGSSSCRPASGSSPRPTSNGDNPDPSMRPDVVNNSWGGGPGDPFYLATVQAWRAAGIIPVFASGNPGPDCGEGGSPGDFNEVFSAGATDINDNIADFSGRGPSVVRQGQPRRRRPGRRRHRPASRAAATRPSAARRWRRPHVAGTIALIAVGASPRSSATRTTTGR